MTRRRGGDSLDIFVRREDAERFVEEVRSDEPEFASYLLIEERELEAQRNYDLVMRRWFRRLLGISAGLFLIGWVLVFVSGYGGNSSGGSEWVWRIGGVMVYASVPTMLMAGVFGLTVVLRSPSRPSRGA